MKTSRTPASSTGRDRQAGRNSVFPVLLFSLLAILGALMPQVVWAADPQVDTQRSTVVVFTVIVLLVGSVTAGLFFASPLRKRFLRSRDMDSAGGEFKRDGEVPAGMTHAWPAAGRAAPSFAQPAALAEPRAGYESPLSRYQPPQPAYYEPPPPAAAPVAGEPRYSPAVPAFQPDRLVQPTQPIQPVQAVPPTRLPTQPAPQSGLSWPAPQPAPSAPSAGPSTQPGPRPPSPQLPPTRVSPPRQTIAPWSTGVPTADPHGRPIRRPGG